MYYQTHDYQTIPEHYPTRDERVVGPLGAGLLGFGLGFLGNEIIQGPYPPYGPYYPPYGYPPFGGPFRPPFGPGYRPWFGPGFGPGFGPRPF